MPTCVHKSHKCQLTKKKANVSVNSRYISALFFSKIDNNLFTIMKYEMWILVVDLLPDKEQQGFS